MKYLFLIALVTLSLFCKGQTKLVEYNGTANTWWAISSTHIVMQYMIDGEGCYGDPVPYFGVSYKLNQVRLLMYRISTAGSITVTIRPEPDTDGEGYTIFPTTILSTGTANVSGITSNSSGEWVTIEMSECEIFRNTRYMITVAHSLPTATVAWVAHSFGSNVCNQIRGFDNGTAYFEAQTKCIFQCFGQAIGYLMYDTKYGNKARVNPYGNKYDSEGKLYIYSNKYH